VNVDIYTFDFKLNHIAKHLKLPAAPRLGPAALDMPQEERLPPVLVVNVQLPAYPVSTATCCRKACLLFCFLLFCLPVMLKVCIEADLASSFLSGRVSAVLLAVNLVSEWCCSVRMQTHYSSHNRIVHTKATPGPVTSLYMHLFSCTPIQVCFMNGVS